MRAVGMTKHGGPEALQVQERPDPRLRLRRGPDRGCGVWNQLCRRDGAHRRLPGRAQAALRGRLRGGRHRRGARRGRARGSSTVERVLASTVFGGYASSSPSRARLRPLARAAFLRARRRDPRQLRDRLGRPGGLRLPAARRACPGPLGRRRRRDRRRPACTRFGAEEIYGTASPPSTSASRELGYDHVLDYKDVTAKEGCLSST